MNFAAVLVLLYSFVGNKIMLVLALEWKRNNCIRGFFCSWSATVHPIHYLAAKNSPLEEFREIKNNRTLQALRWRPDQEPAMSPQRSAGKMCRHNPTGTFHLKTHSKHKISTWSVSIAFAEI